MIGRGNMSYYENALLVFTTLGQSDYIVMGEGLHVPKLCKFHYPLGRRVAIGHTSHIVKMLKFHFKNVLIYSRA